MGLFESVQFLNESDDETLKDKSKENETESPEKNGAVVATLE